MALIPIISQTWDASSVFNPTRMNNIETNISTLSKATGIEYSSGVSVKDKLDSFTNITFSEKVYSSSDNYEVFNMSNSKILCFMLLNTSNQIIDTQVVMTDYFKVVNRVWLNGTSFLCAYSDDTHIYLSDISSSAGKFVVFKIL